MNFDPPKLINGKELKLGDIVTTVGLPDEASRHPYPYSFCTVNRIENDGRGSTIVTLYRPYVHTSDVVYSGPSILTYVGIEEFRVFGSGWFNLYYRKSEGELT